MQKKFEKFISIVKVDQEKQMVYGWASTEEVDSDGEVIKARAFEKALPAYMKFPTLREMHQPIAVGKTKEASIKTNGKIKGLYIGAKIVSKDAWEKVKEGVYPAFSIGGNVVKKMGNVIHELELVEISLVDVPANKASIVELWKGKDLKKDANTAYSMASLMIQVKDKISYYEYLGKDTKKLKKVLEMLKQVVAQEALEPEPEKNNNGSVLLSGTAEQLKAKITRLEALDFTDNPNADLVRKGVILSMAKKAKEIEKADDDQDDGEDQETDADEGADSDEASTDTDSDSDTDESNDESGEKGDLTVALEKIAGINEAIEKLQPSKEDEKQTTDLVKAVSSMAGSLAKVAETLVTIEGRVATLEKTPAAPKSRSAVVHKSTASGGKTEDEDGEKKSGNEALIAKKQARLAELNDLFDQMGAHAFAKAGHSMEATKLQHEIEKLTA